jgi:hypothetical protein
MVVGYHAHTYACMDFVGWMRGRGIARDRELFCRGKAFR